MRTMVKWRLEMYRLGFEPLDERIGGKREALYRLGNIVVSFASMRGERLMFRVNRATTPDAMVLEHLGGIILYELGAKWDAQALEVIEAIADRTKTSTLAGMDWAGPIMEELLK